MKQQEFQMEMQQKQQEFLMEMRQAQQEFALKMQQLVMEGHIKQQVAVADSVSNAQMQQQSHQLALEHQREKQEIQNEGTD